MNKNVIFEFVEFEVLCENAYICLLIRWWELLWCVVAKRGMRSMKAYIVEELVV